MEASERRFIMKAYTWKVNGVEYVAYCDTVRVPFANSYGRGRCWQQRVKVYCNGSLIGKEERARIYNRTWECWEYQTLIAQAFCDEMERIMNRFYENEKRAHDWKRLTHSRRCSLEIPQLIRDRLDTLNRGYESINGYNKPQEVA